VRGAGAVRFGLPSDVRGMPGVFRSSHWASAGIVPTIRTSAARKSLICWPGSPLARELVRARDVNLHEVRHDTLVVDNELKTESKGFEERLRARHQGLRRVRVEAGGAEAALDIGGTDDLGHQLATRA